jgi:uncharacterized membrane protein YoaK (UPF0700 family)
MDTDVQTGWGYTTAFLEVSGAMNNSFPSIERSQTLLAVRLALIAGYLDAYSLLKLGVYISFMSGNTTMAGVRTGEGHPMSALAPVLAIPSFVIGGFAGTWTMTNRKTYSHRLVFLLAAILLCIVLILASHESLKLLSIAVLGIAAGLLNPALPRIGPESVSLTFMSGNLSRLGRHLALAARGVPLPDAEGPWDGHLRRARLDAYIWAGFFIGTAVSGMLTTQAPQFVLPIAIAAMAALAIFSPSPFASGAQSKKVSDQLKTPSGAVSAMGNQKP